MDRMGLPGNPIDHRDLRLPKAKVLASLLTATAPYPFVDLLECRSIGTPGTGYMEIVCMGVQAEVPQYPVNDIRHTEPISAAFGEADDSYPLVLALRPDFPHVPHLNPTPKGSPRSLCLYDQPYPELRLRWNARSLVERIRDWLAMTAEGRLHGEDQALEPLLGGAERRIVLPADLLVGEQPERLHCYRVGDGPRPGTIVATRERVPGVQENDADGSGFVAIPLGVSEPVTHGIIKWKPETLLDLHELLSPVGVDVVGVLQRRVMGWCNEQGLFGLKPIFIVSFQKRRKDEDKAESTEYWAFASPLTLGEVGTEIGAIGKASPQDAVYGKVLFVAESSVKADEVPVSAMLVSMAFDRSRAAVSGGYPPDRKRFLAVGAGALGSQVVANLVRGGFGRWTIVDEDVMLPHNFARHHSMNPGALGFPKARVLEEDINCFLGEPDAAFAISADLLSPGAEATGQLVSAFGECEAVVDMSASVAVARHLARGSEGKRRISLFLSPSGRDLVLLAEDENRSHCLDALEMQYYRALINEPGLDGHLTAGGSRVRYGYSCRDLSGRIPQELVALHSAIGSRAIRDCIASPERPAIRVWRSSESMGVHVVDVAVSQAVERRFGDWTLCTDDHVLRKARSIRRDHLPVETGGTLVGSVDMGRKIVYVVDILPPPPDSEETVTGFVRGKAGLTGAMERIREATAGWLDYVGEWHSHPQGYSTAHSSDDSILFDWVGDHLTADERPPVMLIVGDDQDHRWHVEVLPTKE